MKLHVPYRHAPPQSESLFGPVRSFRPQKGWGWETERTRVGGTEALSPIPSHATAARPKREGRHEETCERELLLEGTPTLPPAKVATALLVGAFSIILKVPHWSVSSMCDGNALAS